VNWLLDTDVICQPGKRHGDARVVAWLEREKNQCYTSAVGIAQLAYRVRTKEGRQRQALQAWLTRLVDAMHGRIFGFNISVAYVWAEQEHHLEKAGKRMPVEDSYAVPRQLLRGPQPFCRSWFTFDGMDQADQIELIRHRRQLATDGLLGAWSRA
jgi:predicted nucleic acid-binding protein